VYFEKHTPLLRSYSKKMRSFGGAPSSWRSRKFTWWDQTFRSTFRSLEPLSPPGTSGDRPTRRHSFPKALCSAAPARTLPGHVSIPRPRSSARSNPPRANYHTKDVVQTRHQQVLTKARSSFQPEIHRETETRGEGGREGQEEGAEADPSPTAGSCSPGRAHRPFSIGLSRFAGLTRKEHPENKRSQTHVVCNVPLKQNSPDEIINRFIQGQTGL